MSFISVLFQSVFLCFWKLPLIARFHWGVRYGSVGVGTLFQTKWCSTTRNHVATSSSKTNETHEWGVIWRENSVPSLHWKIRYNPLIPTCLLPIYWLWCLILQYTTKALCSSEWFYFCRFSDLSTNQQRHSWAFSLFQSTGESDTPSDNWGIDMPGVSGDIDKCGTEGLVSDGERGLTSSTTSLVSFFLHFYFPTFLCAFLIFIFFLIQFPPPPPAIIEHRPQSEASQLSRAERD